MAKDNNWSRCRCRCWLRHKSPHSYSFGVFIGLVCVSILLFPRVDSKISDMKEAVAGLPHDHDEDGSDAHTSKRLSINDAAPRIVRDSNSAKAEGDEPPSTLNSTTSTGCSSRGDGRSCCLQYTWPGNEKTQTLPPEDARSNISRTCADIKFHDPLAACFDPIVYAYSNSSNRPDPTKVKDHCIDNSDACFCSGQTCVKYTMYRNDEDGRTAINETRFCGTVTETTKNKNLNNGCYSEKRGGRTFEVCVCIGDYCNRAPSHEHGNVGLLLLVLGAIAGFRAILN